MESNEYDVKHETSVPGTASLTPCDVSTLLDNETSGGAVLRRSERTVVQTEKGRNYQKELLQNRCTLLKRRIERQLTILDGFNEGIDKEIVKSEVASIDSFLKELDDVVIKLMDISDKSEWDGFLEMLHNLEALVVISKRAAFDHLSSRGSLRSQRSESKVEAWLRDSVQPGTHLHEKDSVSKVTDEPDSLCGGMQSLCMSAQSPRSPIDHINISHQKINVQLDVVEEALKLDDYMAVRKEWAIVVSIFNQMSEVVPNIIKVLPDEDIRQSEKNRMKDLGSRMLNLKEEVYLQVGEKKRRSQDSSIKSNHRSRSSHSTESDKSPLSINHSTQSDKSSLSINQKVKTASLKTEAEILRRTMSDKVKAEAKRKEDDIKGELWRLEMEIAKSEAIDRVYEQESRNIRRKNRDSCNNEYSSCKDDILQRTWHKRDDHDTTSGVKELSHAIVQLANLQSAPRAELDVFNGNPLNYAYFRTTFKDVVERSVTD